KEITELKKKITSTEQQQLRSTSTPEDFKGLKDRVDKTTSDLRDSLQIRKRNKFLRDTEDYKNNQVYKWQYTTYSKNRRPTRRDYSPFSTSSETSRPGVQRKTRRGQRTRIRTTPNGDQVPGIDTINNIVYNISSQCLFPTELNVLQRGLSFCPVPRFNSFQVDQELNRFFFRNIRLKAHFSKTLTNVSLVSDSTDPEFTLKSLNLRTYSSFQPPHIYHPVETYIELVKNDVKKVLESIEKGNYHVRHNLSVEEKRALSTLKENKQIIIKPADKGGSIVVLDRDYYMREIRTQLRDLDTYQPIGNNPTFEISKEIKDLVTHYTTIGIIDTKLGDFLVKQHPVIPVFYTLPKIHKHPLKPPGRPIVASSESLLSPLAMTLEKILSPLVPGIRSYLKDTTDFLTSLKNIGRLPMNCLLVSMDVNSLYTSIRHQDGIESVRSFLASHTNFSNQQQKFCKDLLTLVLTRNFFIFEDQFFIQKKGTAMGSNVAPPYANIFMDHFELTYVYTHPSFMSHAIYWRRYIDDVFLIWTSDIETLCQFHEDLNLCLPGLTFSISYDPVSMNFLDTRVTITEHGEIETDSFVKSTDRNSLLRYDSCHPHHIKRALPKSQHVRVDRIVSNPETSHIRHQEMNDKFRTRVYPDHVLSSKRDPVRPYVRPETPRMAFRFVLWSQPAPIRRVPTPKKEITELKKKITSTEQQLRSTSTPEDFKGLKDRVDKTTSDLRDSLQIRKRNKFLRDTEDYKNNQNSVQAGGTEENEEGATDTDQNNAEWRPGPRY
ncbi:unnamed protein product, partial [Ranitomeya imitator]